MELGLDGAMAFEAGPRILGGIDDELASSAAAGNVQAARSMTRFTACQTGGGRVVQTYPGVGAGWERAANIGVALGAGMVADEMGSRNLWSRGELH